MQNVKKDSKVKMEDHNILQIKLWTYDIKLI
jgi:hypothetical protein